MTRYADILTFLKVPDEAVHSVFLVGSRVYGCATEASDEDFLVVLHQGKRDLVFRPGINITLHTVESFEASLAGHSMFALECLFAPKEARLKDGPAFAFKLHRARLVDKSGETADADWKKATKLWEDELDASQKKLYHSIRVLMFARQILEHGRIVDFGEANEVWAKVKESIEWEEFEPLRTKLQGQLSPFKKASP